MISSGESLVPYPPLPDLMPELPKPFHSVGVIGAGGKMGQHFIEELATANMPISGLVRNSLQRDTMQGALPEVRFTGEIADFLATNPDLIIVATPSNAVAGVMAQLEQRVQTPTTVLLISNGVTATRDARGIHENDQISVVRGCVYNQVSATDEGGINYNHIKKRMAVAPAIGDSNQTARVAQLFKDLGFSVHESSDASSIEWTKLLANTVGATATVTGLTPMETFMDDDLYLLEIQALRDRLAVIDRAGVKLDKFPKMSGTIPYPSMFRLLANRSDSTLLRIKSVIAKQIAKQRNNQPPAAWRQIEKGKTADEIVDYHGPFASNGESPVDQAILSIVQRHNSGEIDLSQMDPTARKALLLQEAGHPHLM